MNEKRNTWWDYLPTIEELIEAQGVKPIADASELAGDVDDDMDEFPKEVKPTRMLIIDADGPRVEISDSLVALCPPWDIARYLFKAYRITITRLRYVDDPPAQVGIGGALGPDPMRALTEEQQEYLHHAAQFKSLGASWRFPELGSIPGGSL
jgi:hypothetical protein